MENEEQIEIGLVDDHKIFRDGIKMALSGKKNINIIWEAEDGNQLMEKLEVKTPNLILMDIRMPNFESAETIQVLRKNYPELKIIVLSMYDDKEMVTKMMDLGANSYLTKTSDPQEIYNAILGCIKDEYYFNDIVNEAVLTNLQSRKTVRKFFPEQVKFSEKEITILKLICEDKTTEEISTLVFLSPRTIETIRQNMKAKAGAKTIAGLIIYCTRNKIIE